MGTGTAIAQRHFGQGNLIRGRCVRFINDNIDALQWQVFIVLDTNRHGKGIAAAQGA
jgi:hypothetical protein